MVAVLSSVLLAITSVKSHYRNFEPPFAIPDSWEWVRLEEIAYVASGSTPSKESFTDSGIPYLKMYNLRNQKIDFDYHPQYISEEIHNGKLARSRAQSGDLIMNIVGPPLGKLAIIPESIQHCNFNQAAVMIRPYLEVAILNQYLFFYLSEMSEINSIVTKGTAGQTNISLSQSQNMRIPVPPLGEMERINYKTSILISLIEDIENYTCGLHNSIKAVKNKILELAMQGKLVPQDTTDEPAADMLRRINPKAKIITDNPHYPSWVSTQLGDVCDFERGITFPSAAKEHIKTTNNIACLRTANIHDEVDLTSLWFVEKTFLKGNHNKIIRLGDIIMSTANSRELVGRSVIIKTCEEEMTFGGFVTAIRTNILAPEFLQLFLKYKTTKGEFSKIATQTTNIANLNTKILSSVYISFPCLLGQKRIVAKIEELYSIIDSIEASLQS